ncbi:MAG: VWA domain-containing protein [Acidobacteria bacterium]|nr:VWA domain-containing protein [Acidobacteriota bacterium]MYG76306.1 VWA domain-containing protein [Acidobacteriota bacterium]
MRVLSATVLAILVPSFLSAGGISESGEGETARGTVPAFRIQAHPEAPTAPGVGGAGLDLLRRRRDDLPRPVWTGQEPLSVVAVFDLSSSVSGARLRAAIAGIQALFSALDDEDRCALLGFTRSVELHAGWDGTCADAAVAAAALRSGGPAAFNNALTLAFGLLADRPGRPVVVIFTDGVDGASWARDSWPLFAAAGLPPTVLSVTAPPNLTRSGRVGGTYGSISAEDLANQIEFEGRHLQDSERDLRGLRNVDPFWALTYLAEISGGRLVRTSGEAGEIEAALAGALDALQPE